MRVTNISLYRFNHVESNHRDGLLFTVKNKSFSSNIAVYHNDKSNVVNVGISEKYVSD